MTVFLLTFWLAVAQTVILSSEGFTAERLLGWRDRHGRKSVAKHKDVVFNTNNHHLMRAASVSPSEPLLEQSSDSSLFDWSREWYPVIPVQDLDPQVPNKATLLGKDFVVWYHKPSQSWRCFADLCPHRLVPLSEGRIAENDHIQCAYHGWEFNETGGCTRIPQLTPSSRSETMVQSTRACATAFPVQVAQGLLWLFPSTDTEAAKAKQPALIAELDDPATVDSTNYFVRDLPYSWDILVENLCDPSHVSFAHHSFMRGADRNNEATLPVNLQILNETVGGFGATKDPRPTNGKYDIHFQAPTLLYYQLAREQPQPATASSSSTEKQAVSRSFVGLGQYCIPVAPGRSRLIARFPTYFPVPMAMWILKHTPRWITHFSQNVVMDSDVVFLTRQDEHLSSLPPDKRNRANYFMPALSDVVVVAFRKWLSGAGGGGPLWLGLSTGRTDGEPRGWIRPRHISAKEGRDALLDRFRQHTEVCSSCRIAHKRLYKAKHACHVLGVLLLAATAVLRRSAQVRTILGLAGVFAIFTPLVFLRPIITRLECAPWPRKQWLDLQEKPRRMQTQR